MALLRREWQRLRSLQRLRPPGILCSTYALANDRQDYRVGHPYDTDIGWAKPELDTQEPSHICVCWPFQRPGIAVDALQARRYMFPARWQHFSVAVVKNGGKLLLLEHNSNLPSLSAWLLQIDLISGQARDLFPVYLSCIFAYLSWHLNYCGCKGSSNVVRRQLLASIGRVPDGHDLPVTSAPPMQALPVRSCRYFVGSAVWSLDSSAYALHYLPLGRGLTQYFCGRGAGHVATFSADGSCVQQMIV